MIATTTARPARSARRARRSAAGPLFAAATLFATTVGLGVCASTYGRWISEAPTAREAAPYAAPFMLFAVGAGASFALSAAATADAITRRRL